MLADAVFAYLHFFGIGCLVAVLAAETALVKAQMSAPTIAKLARIDLGYGLAAALILVAGGGRVAYGLKGPMFYMAAQWVLLALIPLAAVLMARGIGM